MSGEDPLVYVLPFPCGLTRPFLDTWGRGEKALVVLPLLIRTLIPSQGLHPQDLI